MADMNIKGVLENEEIVLKGIISQDVVCMGEGGAGKSADEYSEITKEEYEKILAETERSEVL